ncbi:three-helix bundle dimerization domain-containing protein [Agrococcus versicolor]
MAKDVDHDEVMRQVIVRLQERFPDASEEEVARVAREELDALWQLPVQDYLTILTERAAKKRLKKR